MEDRNYPRPAVEHEERQKSGTKVWNIFRLNTTDVLERKCVPDPCNVGLIYFFFFFGALIFPMI